MRPRPGTPAELGADEPDTICPPQHQRPLDRGEQFDRDHPDAPDKFRRTT